MSGHLFRNVVALKINFSIAGIRVDIKLFRAECCACHGRCTGTRMGLVGYGGGVWRGWRWDIVCDGEGVDACAGA